MDHIFFLETISAIFLQLKILYSEDQKIVNIFFFIFLFY